MVNKENLMKLAEYLWKNIEPENFNMQYSRMDSKSEGWVHFHSKTNCGDIGCPLGWSPFVEGFEHLPCEMDTVHIPYTLNFGRYVKRIYGAGFDNKIINFIFGSFIYKIDNSLTGAVQRIISVCENKELEHWEFEEAVKECRKINPEMFFGKRLNNSTLKQNVSGKEYFNELPSRVKHYLLEWKEINVEYFCEMFGDVKIFDLTPEQIKDLFHLATKKDLDLI